MARRDRKAGKQKHLFNVFNHKLTPSSTGGSSPPGGVNSGRSLDPASLIFFLFGLHSSSMYASPGNLERATRLISLRLTKVG